MLLSESDRKLWDAYRHTKSSCDRNVLIERYLPMVSTIAGSLVKRLPPCVSMDDLVSVGHEALIHAVERYDHSENVKFEFYCATRLRGAMIDEVRRSDPMSKGQRDLSNRRERAREAILSEKGSCAEDEIAERLSMPAEEYEKRFRGMHNTKLQSIEDTPENLLVSDDSVSVDESMEEWRAVLNGLDNRQRLVLLLHYWEGLTYEEIGEVLDVSKTAIVNVVKAIKDHVRRFVESRQ